MENKDKIYDVVLLVGGSALTLYGYMFMQRMIPYSSGLYIRHFKVWSDIYFFIGIIMIVFGFVRRSWKNNKNKQKE
ncbi:MAG: hypothetical protein IIC76_06325 [Bacteroidetes bacterium]|nr:hypothetical protein [Bacteroidota bacterium]